MSRNLLHTIYGSSLVLLIFFIHGCAKEYSCEGCGPVIVIDTGTNNIPAAPWICPDCVGRDEQIELRWSFHNENILLCGMIDTAVVNPERTAFTFFGPSACSIDTGMIISVYLNGVVLNKDLNNISSQDGAFYYYDNVGPTTIFISRTNAFTVTIESYDHQTRMARGTFSGVVYRANGASSYINSGKFKVKLM